MGSFAPRLSRRLVEEIERLAAKPYHAADICRAVGESAERQGLHRPSYEQVRLLVRQARRHGRPLSTGQVLFEVALRARPPDAFVPRLGDEHVTEEQVTVCYLKTGTRGRQPPP